MQFTGVIVYCKDIRKLTAFYRDVFGVTPAVDQPFDAKRFFIFGKPEQSTLGLHSGTKPNGGRAKLSFYVDDLAATRDRLKAASVALGAYDPPDETGKGGNLNLKDPEGNRVIVCGRLT